MSIGRFQESRMIWGPGRAPRKHWNNDRNFISVNKANYFLGEGKKFDPRHRDNALAAWAGLAPLRLSSRLLGCPHAASFSLGTPRLTSR